MEAVILQGRWTSSGVAKIYINDGLAYLPQLAFGREMKGKLKRFQSPVGAGKPASTGTWIARRILSFERKFSFSFGALREGE